jgi:PAS domain-containing protein
VGILSVEERPVALVSEFRDLVLRFSRMAAREGVTVVPFEGDGPRHFQALSETIQTVVLEHFRQYVQIAGEVLDHGGSLRNDQTFLWRFFQRLRLHPPSNLVSEMADGEIIEVHDRSLVQIFRNLRFFELCSYTLDDLLSRPFFELLERDNKITEHLLAQVDVLFGDAPRTILWMSVEEHTIVERDSAKRLSLRVRQRMMAPLRNVSGELVAVATHIPARLAHREASVPELADAPKATLLERLDG